MHQGICCCYADERKFIRTTLIGPWCMAQNADPFGGGDHTLHLLSAHSPRPRAVHAGNVCSADGVHGRPPGT